MLTGDLIERVAQDLGDEDGVLFSQTRLRRFLDEAQRTLVMLRPDAGSRVAAVLLKAGDTRQPLPEGACRFLGLTRNMGSDGVTPGRTITLVERSALNTAAGTWHMQPGADSVDNYAFNADTPDVFYVSPPPAENVYVEMEYAATPQFPATSETPLSVDVIWAGPLREYMMYLGYSESVTDESQRQRAEWHLQKFYVLLGEESKARLIYQPRNTQPGGGEVLG